MASTIFLNVAVGSVFRHWLSLTVEDESAFHDRLSTVVGRILVVLYVDYGLIRSRYPE